MLWDDLWTWSLSSLVGTQLTILLVSPAVSRSLWLSSRPWNECRSQEHHLQAWPMKRSVKSSFFSLPSFAGWMQILLQRTARPQLCPTLCNPMDCSLPGSSVHGILWARILAWTAMPSSRDLPKPGIKPWSPALQADFLPSEPRVKPKGRVAPPLNSRWKEPWDPWIDCGEQNPDHWSTPDCDVRGGSTFRILSHWDSGVVCYSS